MFNISKVVQEVAETAYSGVLLQAIISSFHDNDTVCRFHCIFLLAEGSETPRKYKYKRSCIKEILQNSVKYPVIQFQPLPLSQVAGSPNQLALILPGMGHHKEMKKWMSDFNPEKKQEDFHPILCNHILINTI